MCTCEVCGYYVHVLYKYVYVCVLCVVLLVVCCWLCVLFCWLCCVLLVVLCVVLCVVYNNTKLTCPLTVSGDGVLHELPSVSVSV